MGSKEKGGHTTVNYELKSGEGGEDMINGSGNGMANL
jgi:hypothetical protein